MTDPVRTFRFVVEVDSSDMRDDAEGRLALILASGLHHQFGEGRARLLTDDAVGRTFVYDHLAHDGHHDGHDVALTMETSE